MERRKVKDLVGLLSDCRWLACSLHFLPISHPHRGSARFNCFIRSVLIALNIMFNQPRTYACRLNMDLQARNFSLLEYFQGLLTKNLAYLCVLINLFVLLRPKKYLYL